MLCDYVIINVATVRYYIMIFTWDEDKDIINYDKHGIHLGTAAYVFNDPNRIERPDVSANNNTLENRWQTIGKIDNIVFVAYTSGRSILFGSLKTYAAVPR